MARERARDELIPHPAPEHARPFILGGSASCHVIALDTYEYTWNLEQKSYLSMIDLLSYSTMYLHAAWPVVRRRSSSQLLGIRVPFI